MKSRVSVLTIILGCYFIRFANGNVPIESSMSVLVVAFENIYEQSLLAHSLAEQQINVTLLVSSAVEMYENLSGVKVIELQRSDADSADNAALQACHNFLSDESAQKKAREIQPILVIFPALRHDACLLPWIESIDSIPVIASYGPEQDFYAVEKTKIAVPIHAGGIWSGIRANAYSRSLIDAANDEYVAPARKIVAKFLSDIDNDPERLYSNAEVVLSLSDPIFRTNFLPLNGRLVNIGCHYCRGAHPLPASLQKQLVEFRSGIIAATLDENFSSILEKIARFLPQGRLGQALAWKTRHDESSPVEEETKPGNIFIHKDVDRQDLIGYARTRLLLSHCHETELLEAVFHGTPVICFPRNNEERANEERAIRLGFAVPKNDDADAESIAKIIEHALKVVTYRETARTWSSIVRDRPLQPLDVVVYWLGHLARNARRTIKLPILRANNIRSLVGDSQILSSFLIGLAIGGILVLSAIFVWRLAKYITKRTRKDIKFSQ